MKALAWDDARRDDQSDFMSRLKIQFKRDGIEMSVEKEFSAFEERLKTEHFDFYVTDWYDSRGIEPAPLGDEEPVGAIILNLVRRHTKTAPIFVVSREAARIDGMLLSLARPVFLKSKDTNPRWLAFDICEHLRDLGMLINSKKIFMIFGHDYKAEGAIREVEEWLSRKGVSPIRLSARNSENGILPDLMREMNTCAAFIAICTPDDQCTEAMSLENKWAQPRANVLFEMGIVFGLHRGAQRLTVLQRCDPAPIDCARLPSDWGGYITLRFSEHIRSTFKELEPRLKSLGVSFS
jgi:hypothetical protein